VGSTGAIGEVTDTVNTCATSDVFTTTKLFVTCGSIS
jgi:hypothetical protein